MRVYSPLILSLIKMCEIHSKVQIIVNIRFDFNFHHTITQKLPPNHRFKNLIFPPTLHQTVTEVALHHESIKFEDLLLIRWM